MLIPPVVLTEKRALCWDRSEMDDGLNWMLVTVGVGFGVTGAGEPVLPTRKIDTLEVIAGLARLVAVSVTVCEEEIELGA